MQGKGSVALALILILTFSTFEPALAQRGPAPTPEAITAKRAARLQMMQQGQINRKLYYEKLERDAAEKELRQADMEVQEILGAPIDPSRMQSQAQPVEPHEQASQAVAQSRSEFASNQTSTPPTRSPFEENFNYPGESQTSSFGEQATQVTPQDLSGIKVKGFQPASSPEWVKDKRKIRHFQDDTEHFGNDDPYGFYN